MHAPAPEAIPEEPALVDACFCSEVCRFPELYTDAEHIAQRYRHTDARRTFREYWRLREQRRQLPAPTAEIRRRLLIPLLRRLA